jgi:hypothetical protein
MVVERRNELSVMEERVALPCVLAVWCTEWMNFVYSLLRGNSKIECLLEELDNGTFDDDDEHVFSVQTLVAIFHIVITLTHNKYTSACLPVGKHTREVYEAVEIMVNFLYYYCRRVVVSEVHKLGWILAQRVCGFLNMQPPIKVKVN